MSTSAPTVLVAPAKLTVSLEVVRRRPDGYHDIEAEMVALDLHDSLFVDAGGDGVEVVAWKGARAERLTGGVDNLVSRALRVVGRTAAVRVEKRIPVGGGLGGGSADAAAVLRWAGVDDLGVAAQLGGDVPFCVRGGRALVGGIGERVTPLPYEAREFVLLVPPFGVDTAAVYTRWDELEAGTGVERRAGGAPGLRGPRNGLTQAAIEVEPRLVAWAALLGDATGRVPMLAGSGSTWFVEGSAEGLGLARRDVLTHGREEGRLIPARTVPTGWAGPTSGGAPEG